MRIQIYMANWSRFVWHHIIENIKFHADQVKRERKKKKREWRSTICLSCNNKQYYISESTTSLLCTGHTISEILQNFTYHQHVIIFPCRRGYATERQKGLLIVEKLDYIQSILLRGFFFIVSKPIVKFCTWISEVILLFFFYLFICLLILKFGLLYHEAVS